LDRGNILCPSVPRPPCPLRTGRVQRSRRYRSRVVRFPSVDSATTRCLLSPRPVAHRVFGVCPTTIVPCPHWCTPPNPLHRGRTSVVPEPARRRDTHVGRRDRRKHCRRCPTLS